MKLIMLFLLLFSRNSFASQLGEDPSNVDCIKSQHGSRPFLATIKQETTEQEEEGIQPKEIKTIQK